MIPLKDRNPTRNFPVVTVLLIIANVVVFLLLQRTDHNAADPNRFTNQHAAIPCELTTRRPLSLEERVDHVCRTTDVDEFTALDTSTGQTSQYQNSVPFPAKQVYVAVVVSMFLHGGWLHLGGNMLFLWIFGNNVEDLLGPFRYLLFYLLGGFVATAAQVAFDPSSTVPLIGASGAIAAVMGAYLAWYPRARILTLIFVVVFGFFAEIKAQWVLLGWFALQFLTSPTSGVAWMAHVGGFAFGLVIALLLTRTGWYRDRRILLAIGPPQPGPASL